MKVQKVSTWDVLNRCLEQGYISLRELMTVWTSGNPKKELEKLLLEKKIK